MQKHGKTINLHKNQVNDMYQKKNYLSLRNEKIIILFLNIERI